MVTKSLTNGFLTRTLVFVYILLASTTVTFAEDWIQYGGDKTVNRFFDSSSIICDGNLVYVWDKYQYSVVQRIIYGPNYNNALFRVAINCHDRTMASMTFIYKMYDKVVHNFSIPRYEWQFRSCPPGSIGSALVNQVCAIVTGTAYDRPFPSDATANWVVYSPSSGKNELTMFYDQKSLTRMGDFILVWKKFKYEPAQVDGSGNLIAYRLYRIALNCKDKTEALIAVVGVNTVGDIVFRFFTKRDEWEFQKAGQGSITEELMERICSVVTDGDAKQATPEDELASLGTGWLVEGGYIVTAHHVVEGKKQITVATEDGSKYSARLIVSDSANDLAILAADFGEHQPKGLALATSTPKLGARVFALGYPMTDLLGKAPKLTSGDISSTTGFADDPRLLQISTPVQPGNSGGPLFNMKGEVVGVVLSKLNVIKVFKVTGDIPENISYAVKAKYLKAILEDLPARPCVTSPVLPADLEALVARVRNSVFIISAE